MLHLTVSRLCFVRSTQHDIAKIIENLDPNKAHAHYDISISMLKICGPSIYKTQETLFKQCSEAAASLPKLEKNNIVSIYE